MPLPQAFIEHLRAEGYNPRSNKHSNALSEAIVADLIENCPKIADRAASGHLVYDAFLQRLCTTYTERF